MILQNLAVIHLRSGGFKDAEELLREALKINNNDQDFHYLLGEAYYGQKLLRRSMSGHLVLALGPDPEMARAVTRRSGKSSSITNSGHCRAHILFCATIGTSQDQQLGQQILASLERLYTQFSREVVSRPPATITVILYPDQQYFNITRAAGWSGALFRWKDSGPDKGTHRCHAGTECDFGA